MSVPLQTLSESSTQVAERLDEESMQDFESHLSARTKVPAARLSDFLGWNESRVRDEAKVVSRILKRFAGAVVHSMEDPDSIDSFLVELDLKTISRDHDWRSIFSTVREHEGVDSKQYKRAVLIKYLQYLSFRKRLLDYIHARKAGLEETDELCVDLTQVPLAAGAADNRSAARRGAPAAGFARMPLGEMVEINLGAEEIFEFFLVQHPFELVGGEHPYVADMNGVTCFVRPGRNMMGRHPESDLTIDANFSAVSRAHLMLEWDGQQQFRFMDLSSRGTWLREGLLAKLGEVGRPEDMLGPKAFK